MKNGRLKLRYFLESAEADIVCVDAVSTAVLSYIGQINEREQEEIDLDNESAVETAVYSLCPRRRTLFV